MAAQHQDRAWIWSYDAEAEARRRRLALTCRPYSDRATSSFMISVVPA